jgi:hypothetical protein
MSRECQEIRADRGMRSARRPYPLVHEKDRSGNMVGRSELEKGRGRYRVYIRYRGPSGRWTSAQISGDGTVRADYSTKVNFIPDVEVVNMADEHLTVKVCLDFD